MTLGNQLRVKLLVHFKPQRKRLIAKTADIGRDLDQIVEPQRSAEIKVDLDPWKPDVELVEHFRVRKPHRSKQFRLGDFEEPQELTVKDDPCPIGVRPAYVFFDCESLSHAF